MQFIDLGAQRRRIADRLKAAIDHVIEDGRYILGPQVAEFEQKLAAYVGVKHCIACANGTDALLLPLYASGIGPGDAVFVPSFTFAATAEVVALAKAEPIFVDVDPDTYNINIDSLEAAIAMVKAEGRLKPKAIIPVDLFGIAADYDGIMKIAERENLLVIEDAAQAIGGSAGDRMCGSFGHVAATSFYPAKPLGCYGDGGAMFTNDDELAAKLRSFAFHGKGETQYDNVHVGINSRLDTLQAAILLEKLAILEDEMVARQAVAARYAEGLGDVVKASGNLAGTRSAWAQYAIETPDRDALKAHLHEQGIPSVIYYVKPLHAQVAYERFPRTPGGLPVSDGLPERILCLPMHPYLGTEEQDRVISTIRNFIGRNASKLAAE
jgi:dTDP-4-amino-4,6-dideoxygalactose transaminase